MKQDSLKHSKTHHAGLRIARRLLISLVLVLMAASAGASIFTITLANGTSFESRYRPVVADWDENYVMIRTDRGNWIALGKSDVVDVTSAAESSGFGFQADSSTLYIGFTPGDIGVEGEDEEGGAAGAAGGAPAAPPDNSAIQYGGSTGSSSYGLDQFLDIPASGSIPSQPVAGGGGDN